MGKMKRSENIGPNNENWSKFLKEVNDPYIQGILNDDPIDHINRKTARSFGEHSAEEMRERIIARREEVNRYRLAKCGQWVDEKMKEHFPKWLYNHTLKNGSKLANVLGWYWGAEHGQKFEQLEGDIMPKPYPTTRVFLARRWPRFWLPFIADNRLQYKFMGPFILKAESGFTWAEEDK